MRRSTLLVLLAAVPFLAGLRRPLQQETSMKKATPIMTVDEIEPCLPFWTERLGFEITATVPHEERLGFAMLQKGGVELMYQSRASVEADLGPAGVESGHADLGTRMADGMTTLFIEVETLDPVVEALEGADVVVPRRQTFYGMDEIFVMAPCGTLVGFAAPVGEARD
jgi:uncharacterized glyoxalase superfamily protein PhnB